MPPVNISQLLISSCSMHHLEYVGYVTLNPRELLERKTCMTGFHKQYTTKLTRVPLPEVEVCQSVFSLHQTSRNSGKAIEPEVGCHQSSPTYYIVNFHALGLKQNHLNCVSCGIFTHLWKKF